MYQHLVTKALVEPNAKRNVYTRNFHIIRQSSTDFRVGKQ